MKTSCYDGYFCNVAVRVFLCGVYFISDRPSPFIREIQLEELWLYKFPHYQKENVSYSLMFSIAVFIPAAAILLYTSLNKTNNGDFRAASLAMSLALILNGIFTNAIKLAVGRPRPDFFYRCFPDGVMKPGLQCTGDPESVLEGRKSFPSAHASFAFAGLGFTALYIGGKLHCFSPTGRGKAWRLCAFLAPLLAAMLISISRTCDYRHHWQDVVVGSGIGMLFSYLCYRQYFPALSDPDCHKPLHQDVPTSPTQTCSPTHSCLSRDTNPDSTEEKQ